MSINIKKYIIPISTILVLYSCAVLTGEKRLLMEIGMPKDSAIALNMDLGKSIIKLYQLNKYGNLEISIEEFATPAEKVTYYVYAFVDNKLVYWGYPYEFNRSRNDTIRAIGEESAMIIKKKIDDIKAKEDSIYYEQLKDN